MPPSFFGTTCSGDVRGLFDARMHQSLIDHHFKLRLNLFKSFRYEATEFAIDGWAGCGFDVVYHTVSSFLSSENRWMGYVREFGEK